MSRKRELSSIKPENLKVKKKRKLHASKLVPRKRQTAKNFDDLKWQPVQVTTQLDNFEGFFGLEEVEDIEVHREENTGQVQFLETNRDTGTKHNRISDTGGDTSDQKFSEQEADHDSGDSWRGFSDNDEERHESTPPAAQSVPQVVGGAVEKKQKAKSKAKQKTGDIHNSMQTQNGTGNPFKILEGLDEEPGVDVSAWDRLGLSNETIYALSGLKFSSPTPIQQAAIPEVLAGHDVIGKAATGSGKTLAFGIPMLERFLEANRSRSADPVESKGLDVTKKVVGLILAPTRELAHQLDSHLRDLCQRPGVSKMIIATLTGGLSAHKQQRLLNGADIVVATPGRLWEMMSQNVDLLARLQKARFLVLDEADRLLSEGHFKEVESILESLDRSPESAEAEKVSRKSRRQTLVFSATFHKDLQQKLTSKSKTWQQKEEMSRTESLEYLLKKLNFREETPKFVDVNPASQMAANLHEALVECEGMEKDLYLYTLLFYYSEKRILIFTNSISSVRRLTSLLQSLSAAAHSIHSQMAQKARLRSIERFSSSQTTGGILVATDVAARGLDIPSVDVVVHYHVPRSADMYIHRSGRTARAERSGSSVLLCSPEEVAGVRRLMGQVHANTQRTSPRRGITPSIRSLDIDRRIVAKLRPRVSLAKKISDALLAKEKFNSEDNWLKNAAEELGVDYDGEEFEENGDMSRGRGGGRKKAAKHAREIPKKELMRMKAELKELLAQRINMGVSVRYLSAGGVDMEELISGKSKDVLGHFKGLDLPGI
ncbi:MAG: ATP-dependent RNA helicase [Vezdaea aestivalis]|nr:MAG: ATP-dependent RNA helicase [Vezdaea aestivalis]